jgi:hypothetical protein
MTWSPAASAASATSRPNPVEQPVINQTRPCVEFVIPMPFNVVFADYVFVVNTNDAAGGWSATANTSYLVRR